MTDPIHKALSQARAINADFHHVAILYTLDGNVYCEFLDNAENKFTGVGETMNDAVAAALHNMNGTQMPLF